MDVASTLEFNRSYAHNADSHERCQSDMLRGCRTSEGQAAALNSAVVHFANMLLLQRLRTPADRRAVKDLLALRDFSPLEHRPSVAVSAQAVRLGWSLLTRASSSTGKSANLHKDNHHGFIALHD